MNIKLLLVILVQSYEMTRRLAIRDKRMKCLRQNQQLFMSKSDNFHLLYSILPFSALLLTQSNQFKSNGILDKTTSKVKLPIFRFHTYKISRRIFSRIFSVCLCVLRIDWIFFLSADLFDFVSVMYLSVSVLNLFVTFFLLALSSFTYFI